jgi:glycosyltransferase involved in cell wall biosynthesis
MRILNIIASANPEGGGPIEGILRMNAILQGAGHVQELLTLDSPVAQFLVDFPIQVRAFGQREARIRIQRWARISPRALKWAREHASDYDVVIVNGLWNFATMVGRYALVRQRIPYVVYTHGMLDPWFRRRYPLKHALKQFLWLFNEGPLLHHADAVAFTCDEERILARRSFWPYKVHEQVVRYGTSDPPLTVTQHAEFAKACPEVGGRAYLLFLSRIHEKKGCDLLVKAFGRVASKFPDMDLVIAGPDETGLKHDLMREAIRSGVENRIHWPGMLSGDAKWGAFRGCEAFILPSHQENFGIVVAEAMACAKPVLLSDKVNIWREVQVSGAGLVACDTVEGTFELLSKFMALDPPARAAMGARARKCFCEHFEIRGAAEDLVTLLERATYARGR